MGRNARRDYNTYRFKGQDIYVHKWPRMKKLSIIAVYVDDHGRRFGVDAAGYYYSSMINKCGCYFPHLNGHEITMLDGLSHLGQPGQLTRAAISGIRKLADHRREASERADWALYMHDYAKKAGISLTAAQCKEIIAIRKLAKRLADRYDRDEY